MPKFPLIPNDFTSTKTYAYTHTNGEHRKPEILHSHC